MRIASAFSPFTTTYSPVTDTNSDPVSRRQFLRSLGLAGAVGASGTLLVACGGGSDGSGSGADGTDSESATASADCSDLSRLSDAQKQRRKQQVNALNYVEASPKPNKNCANCQLYQQEKYGAGCGGCQLFPGPVAGEGYCSSWAKQS
nr:high-potential iron-sulfur protein [Salinibacter ruber]